jgi:1,4-dihydroxy-2-naphthoyl-CoA synthase
MGGILRHPALHSRVKGDAMSTVLYEKDGRIARTTLNRPEVLNAIDTS